MIATGHLQTFEPAKARSALPIRADVGEPISHVS